MEIFTLLENLEELLESGAKVPFSTKVMVDIDELRELIEDMRLKIPDELKQAKWVKEERQRIIADAEADAQKTLSDAKAKSEQMLKDAQEKIATLVDDHVITKQALEQKEQIIENANKVSKEISMGTEIMQMQYLKK